MREVQYKMQIPKKSELSNIFESLLRFALLNNDLFKIRNSLWRENKF